MGSIFKMNLFCKVFGYKVVFSKTLKGFLVRDISKQGLKINIGSMSRGWLYLGGIFYRLNQLATSYMVASMHIKSGDVILDVGANVGELGMFFNEKGLYKNKSIDSNRFDENSKVLERTRVKVPPKMVT